jgi:hypothetical protein
MTCTAAKKKKFAHQIYKFYAHKLNQYFFIFFLENKIYTCTMTYSVCETVITSKMIYYYKIHWNMPWNKSLMGDQSLFLWETTFQWPRLFIVYITKTSTERPPVL